MLHPNMPGQYRNIVRALVEEGDHEIVFLTKPEVKARINGVKRIDYTRRPSSGEGMHRYVRPLEDAVYESQAVWRICDQLKREGFTPDIIIGHLGWGQGLYLKDVFPATPILSFFEYYYASTSGAANFIPGEELSADGEAKLRTLNAHHLMNLTDSDWGVCPTLFQKLQHPEVFWQKMSVLHDGIDTDAARPSPRPAPVTLETFDGEVTVGADGPIITYLARNLEPYRGFPTFARAIPKIRHALPEARIVCIGGTEVSYGRRLPDSLSYLDIMAEEADLSGERLHFTGRVPYPVLLRLLQLSSAHVYLTVPFVLSWSMLEAMACEAPLIASDTAPVREVVEDGVNGRLVDFFDEDELAETVVETVRAPERFVAMRRRARQDIVRKYALATVMPHHLSLIHGLARGEAPSQAAEQIDHFNRANGLDRHHPGHDEIRALNSAGAQMNRSRPAYIPDIERRINAARDRRRDQ